MSGVLRYCWEGVREIVWIWGLDVGVVLVSAMAVTVRLTSAHVCQFLKVILVTVHPSLKRSQYFEDATHSIHKSINHICTTTTANHISEHQEQECKQSVLPRLLKLVRCNRLVNPLHLYQLKSTPFFVPLHTQLHFFNHYHFTP